MTFAEYQEFCASTFNTTYHREYEDDLHAALIIATEAIEVLDLFKKAYCYGKPVSFEKVRDELGDVYYGLATMARLWNMTEEEILDANKAKLTERFPNGFDANRAINKDSVAELKAQGLPVGDWARGWDDQGCYFSEPEARERSYSQP